jgi:hypothetical protein
LFAIIKTMPKNQHSTRKLNKPIIINVIIGGLVLIGLAGWAFVSWINYPSLSERLTSTVKEHTTHPEFFTESKLIDKYDDPMYVNINGDGKMGGTFQLSKAEIVTILQSDSLIKCPPGENCQMGTRDHQPDCVKADVAGGVMYDLCVDRLTNRVTWSVVWY